MTAHAFDVHLAGQLDLTALPTAQLWTLEADALQLLTTGAPLTDVLAFGAAVQHQLGQLGLTSADRP